MKKLILIVCNGNIHRSVIAEICLNRELEKRGLGDEIVCISRGLEKRDGGKCRMMDFPTEWTLTKPVLRELGVVVLENRGAQLIDVDIIGKSSLILTMDRRVLNILNQKFPQCTTKMMCLFSTLAVGCVGWQFAAGVDILDLKGITDPELHRKTNELIHSISGEIDTLRFLLGLAEQNKQELNRFGNLRNLREISIPRIELMIEDKLDLS